MDGNYDKFLSLHFWTRDFLIIFIMNVLYLYLFHLDGFPDERDLPHTLHAGEGGRGRAGEGVEAPAGVLTQPTDRRLEVEQ